MKPILLTKGLCKRFGGLTALDHIDFELESGMIAGLIGPNGAGKTTLFNCLTGIYDFEEGDILFANQSIRGFKSHRISALGISRTFQNIRLFNNMTAIENILVGRHCRMSAGIWGALSRNLRTLKEERDAFNKAIELLGFVGLKNQGDALAGNLPYGDQRKLEIARALATEPRLLLLDEPTAGMNPLETRELIHFIRKIRKTLDLTILLIEHDMRVVMSVSDRVTVLDYGVKIAEGSPERIRKDPAVITAYLGRLGAIMGRQAGAGKGLST